MSSPLRFDRKTHRGFTLIELMIVVAIIAILSAIAIPAYTAYVARSKLTEAFSGLSSMSVAAQQYYLSGQWGDCHDLPGACPGERAELRLQVLERRRHDVHHHGRTDQRLQWPVVHHRSGWC